MRVVFAGTPPFAAKALLALQGAGHEIVLALTQPDRPSGRGLKMTPSAVAQAAEARSIPVEKFSSLKSGEAQERLRDMRPDVMVVAAYGLILPAAVLSLPLRGCLNIHASLLPRWRGAAPIHRAILAGDRETGVCIMQMDAGLDTGPVLLRRVLAIEDRDTTGALTDRLATLGCEAILDALANLPALTPVPQDMALATYAAKVSKAEAHVEWSLGAEEIDRQIRAFNPAPGAEASLAGESVKIWSAEIAGGETAAPGTILEAAGSELRVACGRGALRLTCLQRPGGRKLSTGDFLRGKPLQLNQAPKSVKI